MENCVVGFSFTYVAVGLIARNNTALSSRPVVLLKCGSWFNCLEYCNNNVETV